MHYVKHYNFYLKHFSLKYFIFEIYLTIPGYLGHCVYVRVREKVVHVRPIFYLLYDRFFKYID